MSGSRTRTFASRLTGSADLYEHSGRFPVASINFVTAHDGFTMHDLVTYGCKHNEPNGERNDDGCGDWSARHCFRNLGPCHRYRIPMPRLFSLIFNSFLLPECGRKISRSKQ